MALVGGQPRTLGLKEMLQVFLDHRLDVTTRRSRFRLKKCEDRLHLVEGLLIAILDIDDVIAIIRSSDDAEIARERLMTAFDLSEAQANYILELRLRRLTKFSRIELETERDELLAKIASLREILEDPELLRALVKKELREVSDRLGTPRRTLLLASTGTPVGAAAAADDAALAALPSVSRSGKGLDLQIPDDPCVVVLSSSGALARVEGGDPLEPGPRAASDGWRVQLPSTARSQVAVVTEDGVAHRIDVVDLPARFPALRRACPCRRDARRRCSCTRTFPPWVCSIPRAPTWSRWARLAARSSACARTCCSATSGRSSPWRTATVSWASIDARTRRTWCSFRRTRSCCAPPPRRCARRAARPAAWPGMKLNPGAEALGFWVVEAPIDAVVVTVAAALGALPGTGQTTVKVTPFECYPTEGPRRPGRALPALPARRGSPGYRVGWHASRRRAASADGSPVELPAEDERRDGSGVPITFAIASIG